MPPAASKAPLDYLFAVVVGVVVVGLTPVIEPALTRWLVFSVGVIMILSALAVALRPLRR